MQINTAPVVTMNMYKDNDVSEKDVLYAFL